MRRLARRVSRPLIRTSSFLRKEIVEVVRQPGLLVMLVLGPFLILLAFGSGLREDDPAVRTMFVVDPASPIAEQIEVFAEAQDQRLTVEGLTHDREGALRELQDGVLDLVVVIPDDAMEQIRADRRAEVVAYHDQLDPVESQAIDLFTRTAVDEINQLVLRQLVTESQSDAEQIQQRIDVAQASVGSLRDSSSPGDVDRAQQDLAALALVAGPTAALLGEIGADDDSLVRTITGLDESAASLSPESPTETGPEPDRITAVEEDLAVIEEGLAEYRSLSPSTIVSPFEGSAQRVVANEVQLRDYYAPAVVALLLQHLVITFVALSIVRERSIGASELFQVAPMSAAETLIGKYAAHLLLGAVLAVVLTAALVFGLGVPFAGTVPAVTAVMGLVLLASIGLGFVIALLADNDTQAVQYAMLVLLASIFFSGFLLSLDRFRDWVDWVAAPIPAAEGISALRDLMLRGSVLTLDTLVHLGILSVGYLLVAYVLLRRLMRAR